MARPKSNQPRSVRSSREGEASSRVICLTEEFGATLVALSALMQEDPYRFEPPERADRPAKARVKKTARNVSRDWPVPKRMLVEQYDDQLMEKFSGDLFDRISGQREELLNDIGCGEGLVEEAAKRTISEALDALHQCEMLYRCLKLTVDQSPKLKPLVEIMDGFRDQVTFAYESLNKLRQQNDLLIYSDDWTEGGEGAGMEAQLTGPLQRVKEAEDGNVILYRPLLRSVEQHIREVSHLLGPLAKKLWELPEIGGGRPRKYSVGFAILRLADIFQRFGAGHPSPTIGATSKLNKSSSYKKKALVYNNAFYRFAFGFMRTVDRPPSRPGSGEHEFAGTVRDFLKVRELDPDCHLLVTGQSLTKDIVKFVNTLDRLKAKAGLAKGNSKRRRAMRKAN